MLGCSAGSRPDTSVIRADVEERNALLSAAAAAPPGNPVSPSRLHTLILRGRVREALGERRGGEQAAHG